MLEYEKGEFAMHQGLKVKGDHLMQVVTSFIDDAKGKQVECTVRVISLLIMKYDNHFMDGNFAKVRRRVYRFIEREGYSIRLKTHVAQKQCDLELCLDFVINCNEFNSRIIHPDMEHG
jgi:uncharacterized protein YxjI